ncbi:MAG: hypothetical protein HY273_15175 [Gammaproteobacteria bacterium]|nr:hypothetical protein [Gammaproteobacteria bacterium]
MCEFNWQLLLEYLKVVLGWPPVGLAIAILFTSRFKSAIDDFLKRLIEGNVLGQTFKAAPPRDQQNIAQRPDDLHTKATAAQQTVLTHPETELAESLPPELANDPQASAELAYVRQHPAQTVLDYRRLLFSYNAERLFNSIYGTQISLLDSLASRPSETITLAQLAQFHEAHQKQAKRTEYQLRDYVNFLVNFGVLAVKGPPHENTYTITQDGIEFLSYIKANYPLAWNQRTF